VLALTPWALTSAADRVRGPHHSSLSCGADLTAPPSVFQLRHGQECRQGRYPQLPLAPRMSYLLLLDKGTGAPLLSPRLQPNNAERKTRYTNPSHRGGGYPCTPKIGGQGVVKKPSRDPRIVP
jgi:hypothetical protein